MITPRLLRQVAAEARQIYPEAWILYAHPQPSETTMSLESKHLAFHRFGIPTVIEVRRVLVVRYPGFWACVASAQAGNAQTACL